MAVLNGIIMLEFDLFIVLVALPAELFLYSSEYLSHTQILKSIQ